MPATVLPGRVRFPSLATSLRGPHIVCGYGAVLRNHHDRHQPLVRVTFRRLGSDGTPGPFASRTVALTDLGQLRCGDIIDDGRRVRRDAFARAPFEVEFAPAGWRFESASALPAFPRGHRLEGFAPSGFMLVFDLASHRTLWVPCLELFSRCYGASQEVKRVLAAYPWPEVYERLLPPPGRPTTPEHPVVKIVPPLVKADAFFLATLRHSEHAQRVARGIYSQLDVASSQPADSGVFLRVRPFFEGAAQLLVEGEWLSGAGAFLVHRIVGGSPPPGPGVVVVRERDAPAGVELETSPLEPGPPLSRRHVAPDPVEMTADQPPGRGADHVVLHDDAFVVLGPSRALTVEYVVRPRCGRRFPRPEAPVPARYAPGDATGPDPSVAQARLHAPTVQHCDSFLLGMWNAFRTLEARTADLDSVEWCTFHRRFQPGSAGPPELVHFAPYPPPHAARRRWVWLDPPPGPQRTLRGMLVLRCVLAGRSGYVVELQRRSDSSGTPTESFSGLVFVLHSEDQLGDWLRTLLHRLRDTRGVFARLLSECPGRADDFRHPPSSSVSSSEAAARNALSKLRDLLFPESS